MSLHRLRQDEDNNFWIRRYRCPWKWWLFGFKGCRFSWHVLAGREKKVEPKSTTGKQIDTSRIIVDLKVSIDIVLVLLKKKRVQFAEGSTIRIQIDIWYLLLADFFFVQIPESFGRYFIPLKNSWPNLESWSKFFDCKRTRIKYQWRNNGYCLQDMTKVKSSKDMRKDLTRLQIWRFMDSVNRRSLHE